MTRLVERLAGGFPVRAVEFDFQIFTDVDSPDAPVAHLLKGDLDGFTLGIHHGFFRGDDDFGFHARAGRGCEKRRRRASKFSGAGPILRRA
jgi:hypothetical protein